LTLRIIYEPTGRALEYAPLAVSLYRGCSHQCAYCFGPATLHMKPEDFHQPSIRENTISLLKRDAWDLEAAGDNREILMSFTTDPYQHIDEVYRKSRTAIKVFLEYGLYFTVLTKGGLRSTRDFDLIAMSNGNGRYGTTLTLMDEGFQRIWEPFAAPTEERILALKEASEMGIPTWTSCEPVISINETKKCILASLEYVDEFRIGKMNHKKIDIPQSDWIEFIKWVVQILDDAGKRYLFKKELQPLFRQVVG
jgi:DNA repair photolyase